MNNVREMADHESNMNNTKATDCRATLQNDFIGIPYNGMDRKPK